LIQNLYQPYHLNRPTLPLAIAGFAQAETHDSGFGGVQEEVIEEDMYINYETQAYADKSYDMVAAPSASLAQEPRSRVSSGVVNTSQAAPAGDHFAYTINKQVNLARQQSVMVPLVDTTIDAVKSLLFSGTKAARGGMINPSIAVELTNNTGMKLPAGPITVYDAGNYAGDALIEFFPDGAKRFITYGDDLAVTGTMSQSSYRNFDAVTISKGVMTISRKLIQEKTYTFVNNSGEEKRLVIEHPISGTNLLQPSQFDERTDALYRFVSTLPRTGDYSFIVKEESPVSEVIVLGNSRIEALASYASSTEIPANVKAVLQQAITLRQQVDEARYALSNLESEKANQFAYQDRIRQNLEAVGPQSTQGQVYINQMTSIDSTLDEIEKLITSAKQYVADAQKAYEDYITAISL
jgi:virulence-associated protein VapD